MLTAIAVKNWNVLSYYNDIIIGFVDLFSHFYILNLKYFSLTVRGVRVLA